MPLNDMKESLPEVYEKAAAKYKGREVLLERRIPKLDCLWNDVLHLAPINPQIIVDYWEEIGIEKINHTIEVFKVPVDRIDEDQSICFLPQNVEYGKLENDNNHVSKFISSDYEEQTEVTQIQKDIWKQDRKNGRQTFWYSHTTHILFKGRIDTEGLETIEVSY